MGSCLSWIRKERRAKPKSILIGRSRRATSHSQSRQKPVRMPSKSATAGEAGHFVTLAKPRGRNGPTRWVYEVDEAKAASTHMPTSLCLSQTTQESFTGSPRRSVRLSQRTTIEGLLEPRDVEQDPIIMQQSLDGAVASNSHPSNVVLGAASHINHSGVCGKLALPPIVKMPYKHGATLQDQDARRVKISRSRTVEVSREPKSADEAGAEARRTRKWN